MAHEREELLGAHGADRVGSVQDALCELPLMIVKIEHGFFDGALRDETHDRHGLDAPEAMRPVARLVFRRGVPPRIEMNHVVGRRD